MTKSVARWVQVAAREARISQAAEPLRSPKLIRFTELTEDEYFVTEDGAKAGVTFTNTSWTEPLVVLRYFGPEVNPDAPKMGAYRKNKFN